MSFSNRSTALREFLQEHLEYLSLRIGERHLGSTGEELAQDYLVSAFESFGYEVVREPFDTPGWRYGRYELSIGEGERLPCFPCYFSPGGEVLAPLKTLSQGAVPAEQLENFEGCIVFVGNYDFTQVQDTNELAERLEKAGAAGFIINSPYNDTFSTKIVRSPHLKRMPVMTVSQRTALRLAREEGRDVRLFVEAECFDHRSCNIVARHRPQGESRGKFVIGAHYDTAPGIQGAADNASGIAVLLHLARALRQRLDAWEVDFVAFGGEEYGGPGFGIGGFAYMQAHAGEAADIEAMLCLDGIGTYLTIPEARVGRSSRLKQIVSQESTGSRVQVKPYKGGSDQGIFHQYGIPTVWFCDGGASNGVRHFPLHSPQDAVEIIDWRKLAHIAEDTERIAARLLCDGLEEPPPAEILPLAPEDRPEVCALVRTIWTMGLDCLRERRYGREIDAPWQEKTARSVEEYLSRETVEAIKVSIDGRFAGFLSFRMDEANQLGEIGYNAVHPDFGGRNLGRQMLEAALEELRRRGAKQVEVVTGLDPGHAPARAVYEGGGFLPLQSSIRYTLALSPLRNLT